MKLVKFPEIPASFAQLALNVSALKPSPPFSGGYLGRKTVGALWDWGLKGLEILIT